VSVLAVQVASTSPQHRHPEDDEPRVVSTAILHCYAVDAEFEYDAPALLRSMRDVQGAHLVTTNRERPRWCLVIRVERKLTKPSDLAELVNEASIKLGFNDVEMRAPLTSPIAGQPVDSLVEWLDL
jgi:hypothetical protein